MDIVEVVGLALADGEDRVDVTALEPAEVVLGAVTAIAEILRELVANAIGNSPRSDVVRIAGFFERDVYLISVSDRGEGIPPDRLVEFNRVLRGASGLSTRGLAFIARLAGRHGMTVQLVAGVPGITARVTLPAAVVGSAEPHLAGSGVVAETPPMPAPVTTADETPLLDTEAFLDSIFGRLLHDRAARMTGVSTNGSGATTRQAMDVERAVTTTVLRARVPGEAFDSADDAPSSTAGEAAVDIRIALSRYDEGRRRSVEEAGT